ncbi:MAG TPA: HEAT repeat domain-containing protein [Polyangiales bacterium]|nr:HEAT repeat domain-containing protein [Polyangiales bacterium]
MSLTDQLRAIFDAERALRQAESQLLQADHKSLEDLLSQAVAAAKEERDPYEAELRLTRLADLCAQVPGEAMADALLSILDEEQPSVRVQAAEALVDVAYDRYAEVARAIERALARNDDGPAMQELPWVLAEVAEPSAVPLVTRFLSHANEEIVASAIEALTRLGDPQAVAALKKLVNDPRVVTVEEGDEEFTSTVGELASEAIEVLSE